MAGLPRGQYKVGFRTAVMIVARDGESAAGHAVLAEFLASPGHVIAVAAPQANVDSIRPTIFLHDVGVTTRTFLSSPADAKQRAERLLAFVTQKP